MKERIKNWEVTVGRLIDRGSDYVAAFIVLDICTMVTATGVCSILGTIIGFIVGMAPYWSEMLIGWLVIYMALFVCMMDFVKFDLDSEDAKEELEALILELQDYDEDDEEEEENEEG